MFLLHCLLLGTVFHCSIKCNRNPYSPPSLPSSTPPPSLPILWYTVLHCKVLYCAALCVFYCENPGIQPNSLLSTHFSLCLVMIQESDKTDFDVSIQTNILRIRPSSIILVEFCLAQWLYQYDRF